MGRHKTEKHSSFDVTTMLLLFYLACFTITFQALTVAYCSQCCCHCPGV